MVKLVFIHGWALNSGVWSSFITRLTEIEPSLEVECIDLPGYGRSLDVHGAGSVKAMAQFCLDHVSGPAIWVGWSLGGMVAMQAAMLQPSKIRGLQLISTSPRFVEAENWPEGVDLDVFRSFSEQLANDYERTLTMFLLMQAGTNSGSRGLARSAQQAVCKLPNPSAATLHAGINCLAETDLREQLSQLVEAERSMPIQVISGLKDRVAKPASSRRLANMLGAEIVELSTGHAPFMTEPDLVVASIKKLVARV